jgi:hypothetical protein
MELVDVSSLTMLRGQRISVSLSTLCTCCTTGPASECLFLMAWLCEFSDASVCVQHFRNPGTGTSAILVYKQVHRKAKSAKPALVQITESNQDRAGDFTASNHSVMGLLYSHQPVLIWTAAYVAYRYPMKGLLLARIHRHACWFHCNGLVSKSL